MHYVIEVSTNGVEMRDGRGGKGFFAVRKNGSSSYTRVGTLDEIYTWIRQDISTDLAQVINNNRRPLEVL